MRDRQRLGWAILASVVVVAAVVVHEVTGHDHRPSLRYRPVQASSVETAFSAVEARFRSAGMHHGIEVQDPRAPHIELVLWGTSHPVLAWLLTFRDGEIVRRKGKREPFRVWIMVMNADTGRWMVDQSGG